MPFDVSSGGSTSSTSRPQRVRKPSARAARSTLLERRAAPRPGRRPSGSGTRPRAACPRPASPRSAAKAWMRGAHASASGSSSRPCSPTYVSAVDADDLARALARAAADARDERVAAGEALQLARGSRAGRASRPGRRRSARACRPRRGRAPRAPAPRRAGASASTPVAWRTAPAGVPRRAVSSGRGILSRLSARVVLALGLVAVAALGVGAGFAGSAADPPGQSPTTARAVAIRVIVPGATAGRHGLGGRAARGRRRSRPPPTPTRPTGSVVTRRLDQRLRDGRHERDGDERRQRARALRRRDHRRLRARARRRRPRRPRRADGDFDGTAAQNLQALGVPGHRRPGPARRLGDADAQRLRRRARQHDRTARPTRARSPRSTST